MAGWLKNTLPRGLYQRAALILVVPVATLQLAVTVVFLQRHFEDVTRQLTRGVALETRLLLEALDTPREDSLTTLAETLEFTAARVPGFPGADARQVYDISGIVVLETLREELPAFRVADFVRDPRAVTLYVESAAGPLALTLERDRVSASNPHQLLVITILVAALITLVSFLFLRNQLKPVKRLAAVAEAFGKGRTLPLRVSGALEVRAASRAFLDMRNRIERQIEQRTLLLSGVSHDLRTPLTRMRLELSLLEPSPETEALGRDIDEMEQLLNAFLDFSRGAATEEMQAENPAALLQAAAEKARHGGRVVRVAEPLTAEGAASVPMRPRSVARALDNLIGNALRYGETAEVDLLEGPRSIIFRIEDDGPGIPEEQRAEAVKPFARLDRSRNQDRGSGVGLGLAIVADVARSHGGSLSLGTSRRLGGLRADLILPRQ